jgi:hypothetical protein
MKILVQYFVDGTAVDFSLMLSLGLIQPHEKGFVLTEFGKTFLKNQE